MPEIRINLTDEAAVRLQVVVGIYNEATGQALTLPQWIHRHLREIAIQRELAGLQGTIEAIRQQAENDAGETIRTEHERLLGLV
jgi:hypothetical protein